MTTSPLRLGIAGLGRAFSIMLPTFAKDSRVQLVGATDPIAAACGQFEADFGKPTYKSIEDLCAAPDVDAVYIATPHQLHAEHVCIAAAHGKHVLVEKPMAITLEECTRMINAARIANIHLIIGPSHSYDRPIRRVREIVESGRYGAVKMITATQFTDFLYRPRRLEELDTKVGGGVVHSQAAHQMDVVRLLGGGRVRSLRAHVGAWDPERPTEGAYSALLHFEGGAFCSATYSGYGHYDSSLLMDGIGESGRPRPPHEHGAARKRLRNAVSVQEEATLKAQRNYGGSLYKPVAEPGAEQYHPHFGHVVVSCEGADLRPSAKGIDIFADEHQEFELLAPPTIPRVEVIDELYDAVMLGKAPLHDGEWARGTTEACLAILESARSGAEKFLQYQGGLNRQ